MDIKIFTFRSPLSDGVVSPSMKVAKFLSKLIDVPIVFNEEWDSKKPCDVLFIANGASAFCTYLHVVAEAITRAKRLIWIQNDYVIVPPKPVSKAESPFRKAFRTRRYRGLPDLEYWTTVEKNAGEYVNWNSLAYEHALPFKKERESLRNLFYYGYWRDNRKLSCDRFFESPPYALIISSGSKEFHNYGNDGVLIQPRISGLITTELAKHGVGLYLEDAKSHKEFHSPATRFYEMLGAGLPMVFEPESVKMMARAGIDISSYVVRNQRDVRAAINNRNIIREEQHKLWHKDYVGDLVKRVKKLLHKLGIK